VKVRGALRDRLLDLRASRSEHGRIDQHGYMFPTRTGNRLSAENFRNRVLSAAVKKANENLEAEGPPPLPARLTPLSMRRTFCSILYALGADPGTVMDELGHSDEGLALRVYRQSMRRGENEITALRQLVEGAELESKRQRTDSKGENEALGSAHNEHVPTSERQ
jgi:integrase